MIYLVAFIRVPDLLDIISTSRIFIAKGALDAKVSAWVGVQENVSLSRERMNRVVKTEDRIPPRRPIGQDFFVPLYKITESCKIWHK